MFSHLWFTSKAKVVQLQAKELKKDAEDLQDQADIEVGDIAHKMRKVCSQ